MSEPSGWKFRLAQPSDAEAFAQWVNSNPLIDPKDVRAANRKINPTVLYFAVENPDGKVIMFAPIYQQYVLAHLGINPDSTGDERKQALQVGLDGVMAMAVQFGIREIGMLSKEKYPVAQWATAHGFDVEPRQFFRFDINKILAVAEEENTCAPVAEK